ncbi:MAG: O-antigen ligase family protein [Vicinamibacteria bacterium]
MTGERGARFAEALFLAALVAAPWPLGGAGDPARYALAAVVLCAAAMAAASGADDARSARRLTRAFVLVASWAGLQALCGRGAGWPATADALLPLAAFAVVLLFWYGRAQDPRAADRAAYAVLAVTTAQAVFGVVQASLSPGRLYGRTAAQVTAPFGSFVNHNHFAGLTEMGAVLAAGLAASRIRRDGPSPAGIALAGLTLLLVLAHLSSGSRGGAVALGAGFALLVAGQLASARRERRPPAWMLAAALFAAAAAALAILPGDTRARLASVFSGRTDGSAGYRVEAAHATLRLLAAHPLLGAGLGAYADAVPAWKRAHGEVRLTHAESDALELAAETGAIGLGLVALCALAWGQGLCDRLRAGRDRRRVDLAIAGAAAAGALLVHELFDFGLRLPALAFACATLLGVAGAPSRHAARVSRSISLRVAAALALAGLAALAGWRASGAARLEAARREEDPLARAAALTAVLRAHPYLPEAWRGRSQATRALTSRSGVLPAARRSQATADLERALGLRPSWAEAWGDLAWIRLAAGDARSARDAFETARRLDPTHLPLGVQGAELVYRLDGARAAVLELRRVRAANPGWNQDEAHRRALRFTQDPGLLALLQEAGND